MSHQLQSSSHRRSPIHRRKITTTAATATFMLLSSTRGAAAFTNRNFRKGLSGFVSQPTVGGVPSSSSLSSRLSLISTVTKKNHDSSSPLFGITTTRRHQDNRRRFTDCHRLFASTSTPSTSTTSTTPSTEPYDQINKKNGLTGSYDPQTFEAEIYQWWESSLCFTPDAKKTSSSPTTTDKPPYVLPMPPPNVTGRLHMGHAIFVTLQDVLARFHRMRGRPTLWLPGTDHAGIATQLQVEKALAEEGRTREDVGREAFLERAWEYKAEQGGHITRQLRSLGASADWSRERFTMDEDLSEGVVEAFVRLYEKGLVYRGEYMVNWAPGLKTAVSDLEVEYSEEEGMLYYFRYMVEGGEEGEHLPIATTRPETIVGDTALCVHPSDPRYTHLVGKRAIVPLSGGRTIPIIADDYVDVEFGTGALKITPGHDANDYALGKKHGLEIINVMNRDGTMNENAGERYVDLDRFDCRKKLWEDMEREGLVIKKETHAQRVPRSQRGGEVIEPMVSSQWFVKTEGMAEKALNAVREGDITILPKRFEKTWFQWLEDIHDWCISRQLWWGHRIPVWYVGTSETDFIVARNEADARRIADERGLDPSTPLRQDDDVLDTWFSSGLWPFATVGWPQNENSDDPHSDLARFYPSTCLETGYDILFFWVARMAMMGLELTGKSPFSVVYLHGLVRAADGSKMSKTKGNVIDPLDTVRDYGADSLRYSLVTGVTPGQDIPLNMDKIEANRNFANKLWNCCKFVTGNALRDATQDELDELAVTGPITTEEFEQMALPERYIISKCHRLVQSVTNDIENYQLGAAGSKIYEFLWDEYADWYIEISKSRIYSPTSTPTATKNARRTLVYILDTSLRLLHPYMPYVTEHLWHHLPRSSRSTSDDDTTTPTPHALMLADWPQLNDDEPLVASAADERTFEIFQALTRGIRNARAAYDVSPGKPIAATVVLPTKDLYEAMTDETESLVMLAKLDPESLTFVLDDGEQRGGGGDDDDPTSSSSSSSPSVPVVVQEGVRAYLPLSGLVDPEKERKRLETKKEKLGKEMGKLEGRLKSKGFVDKAPVEVVEKARGELKELEDQMEKIESSLKELEQV